mgnify:CR=1 FL=1
MSLKEKRLIILSAPSGAGKTTLCDRLLKDFKNIRLSVSSTTRPKRPYEIDGTHYFFLTPEEFEKKEKTGDFAEWAVVHSNRYGTSKSMIEGFFKAGFHVLFDIDVQGAVNLQKLYGERALLIFIHPPSLEVLAQRLRDRKGDTAEVIERRLQNALAEIQYSTSFDYEITNDNLEEAYHQLKKIIIEECA